jgi:hypothetical protein
MALKYDIQNATENSYSIIENNNNAFRSIKSPGSSSQFKMAEDVQELLRSENSRKNIAADKSTNNF